MNAAAFLNALYQQSAYSRELDDGMICVLNAALAHFGDVSDKTILDFGCGMGATSAYFAARGAKVIAADISDVAIRYVERHAAANVMPVLIRKPFLDGIGQFDFIFGAMILHHIEPFAAFVDELACKLRQKGLFWENNASSRTLVWFRNHLVGKLWVPKYGDPFEFPLTREEVDVLRSKFAVETEYPEMLFWRLASSYPLRERFKGVATALDEAFFRHKWLTRYSYRQYVKITSLQQLNVKTDIPRLPTD